MSVNDDKNSEKLNELLSEYKKNEKTASQLIQEREALKKKLKP